jgi:hypothetical protein
MKGSLRVVIALVLVAVVVAIAWLTLRPREIPVSQQEQLPPSEAPKARTKSEVIALEPSSPRPPVAPLTTHPRVPSPKPVREEIRDSGDLMATYLKYKNWDDPSGEVAWYLSTALDFCYEFAGRPFAQMEAMLRRSGGKDVQNQEIRMATLNSVYRKCAGFIDQGGPDSPVAKARDEQRKRAEDARYPAELARQLSLSFQERGLDRSDKTAMELLNDPRTNIAQGIQEYLALRNGPAWVPPGMPDRVTWGTAWLLLQCDLGEDCGATSRTPVMTCLLSGVCGITSLHDGLRARGMSIEQIQSAYQARDQLAQAIRRQDWARLGFVPRVNASPQK